MEWLVNVRIIKYVNKAVSSTFVSPRSYDALTHIFRHNYISGRSEAWEHLEMIIL